MLQRSPCAYRATLTPEPEGGFTVTFPDVPEAITYGADEREAMEMAFEVLELAIVARMERSEDLPSERSGAPSDLLVPLRPLLGAKAALYDALSRGKVSKSELARRLGVDEAIVRRMLDPARATRVDSLAAALAALGQRLQVTTTEAPHSWRWPRIASQPYGEPVESRPWFMRRTGGSGRRESD